ncbi:hypothetical protein LTR56_022962 [Elasticomyces elasticus]|nr:hypothetical protein LTR56_022962 [Elasticomyces elasticus]KAK4910836.1 hypothetical protein LTR49_020531 [Elasticomyces elasticus]KAK5750413.1 hypothetical protein LTS12_019521 [Elasticomyces elasticus]
MVAIDQLPGVDIIVVVNGQALTEYEYDDGGELDLTRTVQRYIKVKSGDIFEIHIVAQAGFRSGGDAVAFRINVDGAGVVDAPLLENGKCRTKTFTSISRGCPQGAATVLRYKFAELETVVDGHVSQAEVARIQSIVKGLGSIVIEVEQRRLVSSLGTSMDNTNKLKNLGALPEKALKATLESMLIIPRQPTPPPLEERDFDTLSPEEVQELQRRFRALKEKNATKVNIKQEMKRERTDDNPRPRKVARPARSSTVLELDDDDFVRESSTATLAQAPQAEVIDLSDD